MAVVHIRRRLNEAINAIKEGQPAPAAMIADVRVIASLDVDLPQTKDWREVADLHRTLETGVTISGPEAARSTRPRIRRIARGSSSHYQHNTARLTAGPAIVATTTSSRSYGCSKGVQDGIRTYR